VVISADPGTGRATRITRVSYSADDLERLGHETRAVEVGPSR
jgi:hypothetical protein